MNRRWMHWYQRALPAYWISLFCVTHLPQLELKVGISFADKVAHAGAFGLLAFLFWRFAETLHSTLSSRFVWIATFWLLAYAAFDEWLQQFVGRGSDLSDWFFDAAGIILVLALLEHRRRRVVERCKHATRRGRR